jgi:hypothetical protein|tara:strand:+ start:459 stop:659 length:201 start_codon:yes stop_codon:yes gene_type:complete
MKKQGYNSRLNESLGARNGKKSQSMKDRRDESKAMSKKMYGHAYGADKGMEYRSDNLHYKTHKHLS